MGVILILAALVLASVLCVKRARYDTPLEFIGMLCTLLFGGLFVMVLIILPFARMGERANIEAFYETQESLERARGGSEMELAAIQQDVIKMNRWLRRTQYWAQHWATNWFHLSEVLELEPIR